MTPNGIKISNLSSPKRFPRPFGINAFSGFTFTTKRSISRFLLNRKIMQQTFYHRFGFVRFCAAFDGDHVNLCEKCRVVFKGLVFVVATAAAAYNF